jgi:arylsulfatase A-like enzyme
MAGNASRADTGTRPPNVVTIVLDAARAKNFSVSGGDQVARTPSIDSLAARGTSFPRAVAAANWTVPSHFSLFTGTYPNVHGVRTFQKVPGLPETTASHLRRAGYETAMFTENLHLAGGYGLEEGVDFLRSRRIGVSREQRTVVNRLSSRVNFAYSAPTRKLISEIPPIVAPLSFLFHSQEVAYKRDVCGRYTLDWFSEWIRQRSPERPFHAFFNFVDTHDPYDLVADGHPIGFLERVYLTTPRYYMLSVPGFQAHLQWAPLVRGYLRSIEEADRKIGQLLTMLEESGERDRTMVIVTSDHGQSFGEGGNIFHGCGATDSVTRVPLVVAPPAGVAVPRRVDRWVSLCEVDSWIRSAASGGAPYDDDGHAPFPRTPDAQNPRVVYCEGGPASDQVRSLTGIRMDQSWNHRLLAAYRESEKFVLDMDTSVICRWEGLGDSDHTVPQSLSARDAVTVRLEVFGPYEAEEATRRHRAAGGPAPLDVEIDQRLRSWGYD